jgi:hypothetical protein
MRSMTPPRKRAPGARRLIERGLAARLAGKVSPAAIRQSARAVYQNRPRCGAFARSTGRPCEARVWVRPDGTLAKRCRNHGGPSTGPKTQAGKERSELARIVGYHRWLERKREAEAAYWRKVGSALREQRRALDSP